MNVKSTLAASTLLLLFSGAALAQAVDPSPQEETPVEGRSYFDGTRQTVKRDRVQLFQFEPQRLARDFRANTVVIHCPFDMNTMTATSGNATINYAPNTETGMRLFLNGPIANIEMVRRNGRWVEADLNLPNPKIHHFYIDKDGNAVQINDRATRLELREKHARGELSLEGYTANSLEQLFYRFEPLAQKLCFSGS